MSWLEQDRAEGRSQGERHNAGDHDRDSDRDRKLSIELAGEAAEKGHWDEHGAEHEHNGDHRSADFLHRLDRSLAWALALRRHDALDVLEHDDGIVDNDADRQDETEKRQEIE